MSTVVRLRGLPFETNETELINFFTPLPAVSAIITYDLSGRPSGEGFVTFADPGSAAGALAYNRQHLGRRYVEVFESTPQEMASKTNRGFQAAQAQQTDCVVRMRGLPFDVTAHQVVEFFAGFSITEHNVTLGMVADGKFAGQSSGEGWVQFPSQELAAAALHAKNKQMIGGRYVELFPSTAADREISRLKSGAKGGAGATGGGGGMGMAGMFDPTFADPSAMMAAAAPTAFGGGGAMVKMRGLPYSCTPHDVVQFFAPEFELGIDQISLPAGSDGRPSGQGIVTFADSDEASRAIAAKNRQYLGSRYVELSEEGGYGGFGGGFGGGAARAPAPAAKRASPYDAYDPAGAGGWGADPWAAAADPAMMGMLMQMMTMMKGGGKGMEYM